MTVIVSSDGVKLIVINYNADIAAIAAWEKAT